MYTENTVVKSNRVDVRIVDKEKKEVLLVDRNRGKKETEKTTKYPPLKPATHGEERDEQTAS